MANVKIEEEGDPEVAELRRRLDVLEQQQDMLTKALISTALGLSICTKRHVNLREAIQNGQRVVLEFTLEDHLTRIDYAIEPMEKQRLSG